MERIQFKEKDLKIDVNGVTICYDDYGKGEIPVIFIHGFPFDKSSWEPQVEFLKTSQRVIVFDIRGFGQSEGGEEKVSISLFADDLVSLMEGLSIEKAIVCGLSMGGYILLNAVHRYPEKFEAIILSDTQCIADSPETKEKRNASITMVKEEGLNKFADGSIKSVFSPRALLTKKEKVEEIKNIILTASGVTITETLMALANRAETCSMLEEITIPTMILCGEQDLITPVIESERMHKKIQNSVLHIIEDAGHLSNLEAPEKFNQYLLSFITGLSK